MEILVTIVLVAFVLVLVGQVLLSSWFAWVIFRETIHAIDEEDEDENHNSQS